MKNLVIIIGTIVLGVLIVNSLILGDDNSLKSVADGIVQEGTKAILGGLKFGG